MSRGLMRRVFGTFAAAFTFGVVWSLLKGNGSGLRDAAGNVSAPWVVLPLLAGAMATARRPVAGAVVGVAVTLVALVAFYLMNAFVLDLGPHSTLHEVALTMGGGCRERRNEKSRMAAGRRPLEVCNAITHLATHC